MTMTKKSHVVNVPVPVDDPVPLVNVPAPDDAPVVWRYCLRSSGIRSVLRRCSAFPIATDNSNLASASDSGESGVNDGVLPILLLLTKTCVCV